MIPIFIIFDEDDMCGGSLNLIDGIIAICSMVIHYFVLTYIAHLAFEIDMKWWFLLFIGYSLFLLILALLAYKISDTFHKYDK